MTARRTVTITDSEGHDVGTGRWDGSSIVGCDAQLGATPEDSERVYDALDEALSEGAATASAEGYTATIGPLPCECGEATGVYCEGTLGPDAVRVEWMPESLRSSHEAAGNAGAWPHNGSVRLRCTPECAEALTHLWDEDGETDEPDPWARVVR